MIKTPEYADQNKSEYEHFWRSTLEVMKLIS